MEDTLGRERSSLRNSTYITIASYTCLDTIHEMYLTVIRSVVRSSYTSSGKNVYSLTYECFELTESIPDSQYFSLNIDSEKTEVSDVRKLIRVFRRGDYNN